MVGPDRPRSSAILTLSLRTATGDLTRGRRDRRVRTAGTARLSGRPVPGIGRSRRIAVGERTVRHRGTDWPTGPGLFGDRFAVHQTLCSQLL